MDGFRRPFAVPVLVIWRCRRWLRNAGIAGKGITIPLLSGAIGINWLLNNLGILPMVDWILTGNIGTLGILTVLFGRWNRINFVIGTFLTTAAVIFFLQQTGTIREVIEGPCLVIVFSALLLLAKLARVPVPFWMKRHK